MKQKRAHKDSQDPSIQEIDEQGTRFGGDDQHGNATDLIALHRARMFDWNPTAVTALSGTADGTVLAAARESGNLELWNADHWTLGVVCLALLVPNLVPNLVQCIQKFMGTKKPGFI